MGSWQVPGLSAVAVAVSTVPAGMAAPSHGRPSLPGPGDAAIASGPLASWLHNVSVPRAGQVLVREDYLPRLHWHAETFSNVQFQQGRAAPIASQLCKPVPPWEDQPCCRRQRLLGLALGAVPCSSPFRNLLSFGNGDCCLGWPRRVSGTSPVVPCPPPAARPRG